jgi:serine protease Do
MKMPRLLSALCGSIAGILQARCACAARRPGGMLLGLLPLLGLVLGLWAARADVPEPVLQAEAQRVAVIDKVRPTVVAIFARGGQGGGSGVLISKDGYALTNYHVIAPAGPTMQCGLPDGLLYDAVIVGQDKVGDVALIKLLPARPGQEFPYAVLGDSDQVQEGDWSLALGNPFLLATDFNPTVTFGLISGVHRYQEPAGIYLEYTDCIQIDTSINPGNSGGPLFNLKGELIGINGRGSFDKRGRVNSGVGYAVSINQIKNFLGHLRAGLDVDHASLGATAVTPEGAPLGVLQVNEILEDCDAARRGLALDDELVALDGRPLSSVNQLKNVLGLYPRGWRVPLVYRRGTATREILVRLMGVQPRELLLEEDRPSPAPQAKFGPPPPAGPAARFYEKRPGFANYYFNRLETARVWQAFRRHGDFLKSKSGSWFLGGAVRLKQLHSESPFQITLTEEKVGGGFQPVVRMKIESFPYQLEPLKEQDPTARREPQGSGGFLAALYLYQLLLTQGLEGFRQVAHGGREPIYPPPRDGKMPPRLRDLRVDAEVLQARFGPYLVKWYFDLQDSRLLAFEVRQEENEDPCEVYLSDYRPVAGRLLPHCFQVRYGDSLYGTFRIQVYRLAGIN